MALNKSFLQQEFYEAFNELFPVAFTQALDETFAEKSELATNICENFGKTITELLANDLSIRMAEAIDTYVKNADINGTIITVGSPSTQTAKIKSPKVVTNGFVPNTLRID